MFDSLAVRAWLLTSFVHEMPSCPGAWVCGSDGAYVFDDRVFARDASVSGCLVLAVRDAQGAFMPLALGSVDLCTGTPGFSCVSDALPADLPDIA